MRYLLDPTSGDIDLMKHQLAEIRNTKQLEKTNLENFDNLNFNVYSVWRWPINQSRNL